jgi:hypothetical protein
LAKTTGDAAEYVLPDGRVRPVFRLGPPRISEHVSLLRRAERLKADAVVAEGMALQPETVFASERILRATHAVITNVRPDHQETMGGGREGVCRTLGLLLPERGVLFTSREAGAGTLQDMAAARGVECVVIEGEDLRQGQNLAAAVCAAVTGRETPPGEEPAGKSPGARMRTALWGGLPVRHCDLFSANDTVSAQLLLHGCGFGRRESFLRVALLATRADRPLRTRAFLDWLACEPLFDAVVPLGGHALYAWLPGRKNVLRVAPFIRPHRLLTRLCRAAAAEGRAGLDLAGLGNAHGCGGRWRSFLAGLEDRDAD